MSIIGLCTSIKVAYTLYSYDITKDIIRRKDEVRASIILKRRWCYKE